MSDSTKKSAWESLASELGVSHAAVPPPPPPAPAPPRAPEPSSGTPSTVSMRPAPKASWQNLAEFFGIASAPAGAPPAQRSPQPSPPPAPAPTPTPAPAQSSYSTPTPIRDEPLLLTPLAADTYKFEVVEETEIEFDTFARGDAEPEEPSDARRESGSDDSTEPGGQRKRRRRRRRRRGGRSESAAPGGARDQGDEPNGRGVARPMESRSSYDDDEPVEAELVHDVDPQHHDQPLSEEELDAIEEAARREDLGLPPLSNPLSNRPSEPRRGGRRRRRGRRGGSDRDQNRRSEAPPRTPMPDGVAHGDEYDILDDSAELPSFGDRPYGTDQLSDHGDHADDEHDHLDADGDSGEGDGAEGEAGEPLESLHRNIHTWEQTVGTIIAKNMESRARSPGNPNQRGRGGRGGRPRGRGGRGRSGGGGGGGGGR
ncbi:MAG: hypothetical protein K8T91_14360 [Planctomycetes bacterium]|nr:hypothetical protein [Planctomycetota bacterium]